MSSQGPRYAKSNENVLRGDNPTGVNPEASVWRKSFHQKYRGPASFRAFALRRRRSFRGFARSAYWGGDSERIPGDRGDANATARPCPLCDTGMVRTPACLLASMCPRLLYQTQKLVASIHVRQLRIGLPMIAVGGALNGWSRSGRQLGLLWIFGWKLPFFRMQSGRSHNCLTKLLERHLCVVCARRTFF